MLPESLKNRKVSKQREGPLWTGSNGEGPNGGITQGLLAKWLVCRERTRLLLVKGLKNAEKFSHRLEYGNLWHVCEEAEAKSLLHDAWLTDLNDYARKLLNRFPYQRSEVEKWWNICRIQFPEYVKFWQHHPDQQNRTPLMQEQVFDVPHRLPSGRIVRLRGKWDSVDLVDGGIWLMENKTKGDIDEQQIRRQLTFDLQTMLYLTALQEDNERLDSLSQGPAEIAGIRYNVVRRPLSGGRGTIVQREATQGAKCPRCGNGDKKPVSGCPKCGGRGRIGAKPAETTDEYMERLANYIRTEPDTYFMRWNIAVGPHDIERFRNECLDPILEQLCDWWDEMLFREGFKKEPPESLSATLNFKMPFGVASPLLDGGATDLDAYLESGNEAGLQRTQVLFPELMEGA